MRVEPHAGPCVLIKRPREPLPLPPCELLAGHQICQCLNLGLPGSTLTSERLSFKLPSLCVRYSSPNGLRQWAWGRQAQAPALPPAGHVTLESYLPSLCLSLQPTGTSKGARLIDSG